MFDSVFKRLGHLGHEIIMMDQGFKGILAKKCMTQRQWAVSETMHEYS